MSNMSLLLALVLVIAQSPQKTAPAELEGVWHAVSMEGAGKPMPPQLAEGVVFTFKGEKLVLRGLGGNAVEQECTIVVDPTASPKGLDFTPVGSTRTVYAIYEIGGEKHDELKIAFVRGGAADSRPTTFTTAVGSNGLAFTLKRR
jgi:uncharacterized protein (TIGR03067 family)